MVQSLKASSYSSGRAVAGLGFCVLATAPCPSSCSRPQMQSRRFLAALSQPRQGAPSPSPAAVGVRLAGLSAALAVSWNGPVSSQISAPWQLKSVLSNTPGEWKPWGRGSTPSGFHP